MATLHSLEDVLSLALQLQPREKLQLIEQVAISIKDNMPTTETLSTSEVHWGKSLNKLLDSLDMSDWEAMEIDDVVEWVRDLREREANRFQAYWDGEK